MLDSNKVHVIIPTNTYNPLVFFKPIFHLTNSFKNPIPPLHGDALTRLQRKFKGVHLMIIDEKSMVGAIQLYQIDQRLRQAKVEGQQFF